MKGFLVLLHRETCEFWLLLPASLIAGLVCALWPAVHGATDPSRERLVVSTMVGVGSAFGMAVVLGAIVLGRDLFERRLGFYFARPLSAAAIWAGKFFAVPILSTAAAFLIWLPACIDTRVFDDQTRQILHSPMILFVLLGTLGIAAVSHVFGTWFRSRSRWLLFDLPALAMFVLLDWRILESVAEIDTVIPAQQTIGFLVMIAASVAGFAQIAVGRTDLDRGRRTLSLVLWGVLLGGTTLIYGIYG